MDKQFKIYKVGGCVRDALLGVKSKDIDFSFEKIDEIKNLYLKGISQKDIHLILSIPYSSVRNIVQRLRKLKKII